MVLRKRHLLIFSSPSSWCLYPILPGYIGSSLTLSIVVTEQSRKNCQWFSWQRWQVCSRLANIRILLSSAFVAAFLMWLLKNSLDPVNVLIVLDVHFACLFICDNSCHFLSAAHAFPVSWSSLFTSWRFFLPLILVSAETGCVWNLTAAVWEHFSFKNTHVLQASNAKTVSALFVPKSTSKTLDISKHCVLLVCILSVMLK